MANVSPKGTHWKVMVWLVKPKEKLDHWAS